MEEEKKPSFLDRLKKTSASDGAPGSSGSGFASKFAQNKNEARKKIEKPGTKGPFAQQRGLQKRKVKDTGFAETLEERNSKVFLVRGQDGVRGPAWHYILVSPKQEKAFLSAARTGSLDVADHGKVLYSGWGENPPEDIKNKIEEEYN